MTAISFHLFLFSSILFIVIHSWTSVITVLLGHPPSLLPITKIKYLMQYYKEKHWYITKNISITLLYHRIYEVVYKVRLARWWEGNLKVSGYRGGEERSCDVRVFTNIITFVTCSLLIHIGQCLKIHLPLEKYDGRWWWILMVVKTVDGHLTSPRMDDAMRIFVNCASFIYAHIIKTQKTQD